MIRRALSAAVFAVLIFVIWRQNDPSPADSLSELRGKVVTSTSHFRSAPGALWVIFVCEREDDTAKLAALKQRLDECPGMTVTAIVLDDAVINEWDDETHGMQEYHTSTCCTRHPLRNAVLYRAPLS